MKGINIVNLEEFTDYNNKTLAEFAVAERMLEIEKENCVKQLRFIDAFKIAKLEIQLQRLKDKKRRDMYKVKHQGRSL